MKKHLHDLETFWEHFELSVLDFETDETFDFQVNQYKDQRKELKTYLRTFKGFSIGFNTKFYDFIVLSFIDKNNYFLDKSVTEFNINVKGFSDYIINLENDLPKYEFVGHFKFTIIDLFYTGLNY